MDGLDKFKEAFEAFSDNYVIIGGTACEITLRDTEMRPRATHDIDMIVIVERMTPEFGSRFWNFVHEAGYRPEKRRPTSDTDNPRYELYRFVDGQPGYPEMIELLSRHPDILGEPKGLVIEPLPIDDNVSSLSAIIMDDDYYHFTIQHSRLTDGIRHADAATLVVLKSRAYLNLLMDKQGGKHVNTKDIKKHRSDVLKNVVIVEDTTIEAAPAIVQCIRDFVQSLCAEQAEVYPSLAKALGTSEEVIEIAIDRLGKLFVEKR